MCEETREAPQLQLWMHTGQFHWRAKFSVCFGLPISITFTLLTFSDSIFPSSMKELTEVWGCLNCGKVTMYHVEEAGLCATWIWLLLDSVVTDKAIFGACGCFYMAREKINPYGTGNWICLAWRRKAWGETNSTLLLLTWKLQKRRRQTRLRGMQQKDKKQWAKISKTLITLI